MLLGLPNFKTMGNMSYCRFQNTASDFEDCVEELRYGLPEGEQEQQAAKHLYELSKEYIEYYEKETKDKVECQYK